jgi:DNA repair protein RadC
MQVKLTELEKIRLINTDDIYNVMQRILMRENKIERNKERFWIIGLAVNNRILYVELISVGNIRTTLVEPMEIFSIALQKRTVKIILVHNHPSGSMVPSDADKDITDKLIQVGFFLNIPVLDHLIISEKSFYSFSDSGLLHDLTVNTRYILPYKVQEKMKKEVAKNTLEKRNTEIVKMMAKKKLNAKQIAEFTGLSIKEINTILPKPKATPKPTKK